MKGWKPILLLLILSPAIPELTTGSTPVYRYINPIVFLLLTLAYGFPALIYREIAVMRGYGLKQIALLGTVQGVYVEGILVNTYYNPNTDKNGIFGHYGRLLGVNWPWATYLTIFHSIYSVIVPILLVEAIYPEIQGRRMIGDTTLRGLIVASAATALVFNMSPETYRPPETYHLFSLLLIAAIYLIVEESVKHRLPQLIEYPVKYIITYPIVLVIILFYASARILHPALHILLGVLFYTGLLALLDHADPIDRRLKWRISSGLLAGMNITGIITGLMNPTLMHVIAPNTVFLVWLIYMNRRFRRREIR